MDFRISPATQELLDQVETVMNEAVFPLEPAFLSQRFSQVEPLLRAARDKVKAAGLWAPQAPSDVGGMGLPLTQFALISECIGQSPIGHYAFGCQAPDAGNIELLHRHGSPAQRETYLLPLVRGDVRSCFAMTEPDSPGSNPTQLRTRARIEGDHYVIEGHKWFTSSCDGAAFAVVMAVTEPDAPPHKRASMILCPTGTPGFVRVRNIPVMGEANDGFASHSEVRFEGCRVPIENRIGAPGSGFMLAQERLGPGRIHHCMRWIGICERAFRLMCERAVSRQIDDHESLAHKQIVQAFVAESRAEIDAARLLILRTAARIDEAEQQGSHGFQAAQEDVSLIKFHVANVLMRVVDRAIQVHGALGITNDTVLAYFYGHERGARIYDGPDEVHKLAAARRILKRYESSRDAGKDKEPARKEAH